MRNQFGRVIIRTATVAIGLWLAVATVTSQAPAYRAPRTPDGKPNFNGIWQALNTAYWDIEAHSAGPGPVLELGASGAIPGGLGVVEGDGIPYKPEALAKKRQNYANRLKLDPEIKCYLPGVPRAMYMPFPFQLIQTQKYVMMIHEYAGAVRTIYMDDQKEAPADSWMGWSNGRWEGETLVVDTTGFNESFWMDRRGLPHTEKLRTLERFTRTDSRTIKYEVTVDDPSAYTAPWTSQFNLGWEAGTELFEYVCQEANYAHTLMVGDKTSVDRTSTIVP